MNDRVILELFFFYCDGGRLRYDAASDAWTERAKSLLAEEQEKKTDNKGRELAKAVEHTDALYVLAARHTRYGCLGNPRVEL